MTFDQSVAQGQQNLDAFAATAAERSDVRPAGLLRLRVRSDPAPRAHRQHGRALRRGRGQSFHRHRCRDVRTARSGEIYEYVAYLGNYLVMVTANPLMIPNKPAAPVNIDRAKTLLTDAVAALRSH